MSQSEHFQSVFEKEGAHYNVFAILSGMAALRVIFPSGEANEFNVALFSTSGIHGTYTTIEELESSMLKYGETKTFGDGEYPDDYHGNELTVLIVQPRIVCLRYGHIPVTLADIPWLKNLRASSWRVLSHIGEPEHLMFGTNTKDAANITSHHPRCATRLTFVKGTCDCALAALDAATRSSDTDGDAVQARCARCGGSYPCDDPDHIGKVELPSPARSRTEQGEK